MAKLTDFENKPVTRSSVEIPGAAGGLRDALKVDPIELGQGSTCYVLLECEVDKIRFEPIDKAEPEGSQNRVHVLGVAAGTIMDPSVAKPAVEEQRTRIREAKEAEAGIQPLDFEKGDKTAAAEPAEGEPVQVADAEGFVDMTLVRRALEQMDKTRLRAILDGHTIKYPKSATGAKLCDLIIENVPNIAEELGNADG